MCIKALDERGLDDFELADKRAACVDFDLRMLMCDDRCRLCSGRGYFYGLTKRDECPDCHGTGEVPDDLSPCCGAAIERVYYKFGGLRPCNPDDADYSERVCGECGKPCDVCGEKV
jgi:hypothetical protein